MFFSHATYMGSIVTVFMSLAILTPVMELYPRAIMWAYGSQFLQGTFLALIAGASRAQFMPYRRTNTFMWSLMII
jgi:hypothetical protein